MPKTLPARSEIPVEHTWDLETIYPSNDAWEKDFASVPPLLDELEGYQGKLSDAQTLLQVMKLEDKIGLIMSRMAVYAFLRRDEDTTNATYQALADRAQVLGTRAGAASSFIRPELLALPDGSLERFMEEQPDLQLYRHV